MISLDVLNLGPICKFAGMPCALGSKECFPDLDCKPRKPGNIATCQPRMCMKFIIDICILTFNTLLISYCYINKLTFYLEAGDNVKCYTLYFQHAVEKGQGHTVQQVGIAVPLPITAEDVRRNTMLTCRKNVHLFQKKVCYNINCKI